MRRAELEPPNQRAQSLIRWRAGLGIAAVALPLALFLVFERQARRLDGLATRGELVDAHVTGVSLDEGTTFYAYSVNGTEYTWNVARADAPYATGHVFPATYLPDDPTLSRPIADRTLAAREAERNRRFSWKAVLGLAATLALFAALTHRDLRRLRLGAPSELSDPRAYKRRLALTSIVLLPAFVLIGGFHIRDAMEKGESVLPGAIALCLAIALVGGVFFFAGRDGPMKARQQSARILRWVAPIATGVAILRLVALLFGK